MKRLALAVLCFICNRRLIPRFARNYVDQHRWVERLGGYSFLITGWPHITCDKPGELRE